ncbi:MAG TPA: hypothetical protein VK071_13025 [Tissierellales bacterium]|nr:hypothetical protein [Tissierellales bacterium]
MATQTKRLASGAVGSIASNVLIDEYDMNPYVAMGIGMGISNITYKEINSIEVDTTMGITVSGGKGVDEVQVDKDSTIVNTQRPGVIEIRTSETANEEWFKGGMINLHINQKQKLKL